MREQLKVIVEEYKETLKDKNIQELKGIMLEEVQEYQVNEKKEDALGMAESLIKIIALGQMD